MEDLKQWIQELEEPPIKTVLIHGEPDSLKYLKGELELLDHNVEIAKLFETIEL